MLFAIFIAFFTCAEAFLWLQYMSFLSCIVEDGVRGQTTACKTVLDLICSQQDGLAEQEEEKDRLGKEFVSSCSSLSAGCDWSRGSFCHLLTIPDS